MKVRQKRLLALLTTYGFGYGPEPRTTDDLVFTRPSHIDGLFESIIVCGQGKRGEAVSAQVGVAVTNRVAYKTFGDVEFLGEIGEDPLRGWTIITDEEKARRWETRLAEVGPVRAKEWANARGPQLLQETVQLLVTVDKYLALLEPAAGLEQQLASLKNSSGKQIVEDAERLGDHPLFSDHLLKWKLAYRISCHLILLHSEEVEGMSYFGQNPMDNDALQDLVKILADKILQRPKKNIQNLHRP